MLISNIDIREFNGELYVSVDSYLNMLTSYENLKKVISNQAQEIDSLDAHAKELECRVDLIKDEANSRISELTKELGKRDAAIEDLKRSADREIADLQKKFDTLGKNSSYLESMNYYKKAYEAAVGMCHRLEDEEEALHEDLDKAHVRIEELEELYKHTEKLYKQADKLAGELMECCNGCMWAQERARRDYEADELRHDIATLEELVAEKENAFHEVTCKLNEANSKVKELTGLYDQACDYIDELEDEITLRDSSEPCETYCKAVNELTSYIDDLSDKYHEKAETVSSLEVKITELTARIQELETVLDGVYTLNDDRKRLYEAKIGDLTSRIQELEKELNEAYTISEDRRRLYNELKRNYDDLMTYVECLQNENADLANLNSRDLSDVDSLCAELEYTQKEYDSLAHDYMISEANVQALEEEIAKLEKELEDAYR